MEIHSAWGTFEWLLTDGFELEHRAGVVCNSDGHKGRPGASYPGAASFGAYGGLTCFVAEELTRDAIFECLQRRHHYGTTGNRLHLDVARPICKSRVICLCEIHVTLTIEAQATSEAMMGDIVQTKDEHIELVVECISPSPIERIEILNGVEVIETLRGFDEADLGRRIRVIWQGAEYRGRGRKTTWQGSAVFDAIAQSSASSTVNEWNHERPTQQRG